MAEPKNPTILLVDDRLENVLALQAALQEIPCTILTATSGQEALRLVLKHAIDLALLDVQMPEMDGFELAKLIHGKQESQGIQIIFITAISKELKYIEQGYAVGAVNYLFKPIEPEELRNKVRVALQWAKYQRTMRTHKYASG